MQFLGENTLRWLASPIGALSNSGRPRKITLGRALSPEAVQLLREVTGNNIPVLHRIFVRIQGVIMKEYWNIPSLSQRRIRAKRQVRWGYYFLWIP